VRRVPGLRAVLDHAGKPDLRRSAPPDALAVWTAQVRALAAVEGSVCKVSGLVTEADPAGWTAADLLPAWDVLLEAFGPRRLAFGSDWPVCLLAAEYAEVLDLATGLTAGLSAAERAEVFAGTARRWYGLPAVP
jgi:L-fuconolactonase